MKMKKRCEKIDSLLSRLLTQFGSDPDKRVYVLYTYTPFFLCC